MPNPGLEAATGIVDGVNRVYTVRPYVSGTLAVFLNGQLKRQPDADGWAETSPAGGSFTMAQAPLPGDVVQAFYMDQNPTLAPLAEVTRLEGRIRSVSPLEGVITEVDALVGVLS